MSEKRKFKKYDESFKEETIKLVSPWREKRHGRVLTSEVRKDPPRTTSQAFDTNLANQG